jgi:deoxyribodipyrimidine photo-lyase
MKKSVVLIWFRNDLRLTDNEVINYALEKAQFVIPLFVFDDRQFGLTHQFKFKKSGAKRTQFLIEAVKNLKENLQQIGSDLIIKTGLPENIIPELCKQYLVKEVVYHKEVAPEEVSVEENLKSNLFKSGVETTEIWGSTLTHHDDLPFPLTKIPSVFTKYKNLIECNCEVRNLISKPKYLPLLELQYTGNVPTLEQLGYINDEFNVKDKSIMSFEGGESAALARLHYYFWEKDLLKSYETTRNGLLGDQYSSKFSAWLAIGCISPRYIYHEVKKYEAQRIQNKSTYWMIFELYWRDFFRFTAAKHYDRFFAEKGIATVHDCDWKNDFHKLELWRDAKTGFPFIDANMRELQATGYMSNRGRQNVASFLVKDLKVNWLMGAEYFESMLIDYDVCSNYGNWAYLAGVGQDPRENRYFNIVSQSERYDHHAEYIKFWLPELQHLDAKMIHHFHTLSDAAKIKLRVEHYPEPIVKLNHHVVKHE